MNGLRAGAETRAALAVELAPAQTDAERRFGEGRPPAWQPARPPGEAWPQRRVAVPAVAAVAVPALVAALAWHLAPAPVTTPTAAMPAPVGASVASAVETSEGEAEDSGVQRAAPAAAGLFTLTRDGTNWRIDAAGANRLVAAQRLVQFDAGTLHGDAQLLAGGPPLHLQWQGRRLADAWPALLGDVASYALRCELQRCDVWLIAAGTPESTSDRGDLGYAHTAAVMNVQAAAPASLPPLTAADRRTIAQPSESDSTEPRVASHHD